MWRLVKMCGTEDVYGKERHVGERWVEEYGTEMCEVEVYGVVWY